MSPPLPKPNVDGTISTDIERFSSRQHSELAALCARQHGVVTLEQLKRLGLTERAIHQRVEVGRLFQVHQGVYSLHPFLETTEGGYLAAVLACGRGAVLSHRSAAHLWGLGPEWDRGVDITAPHRRGRNPEAIAAHRDRSVLPQDRATKAGIPCTSVPRTLLDLAGVVGDYELRRAVSEAEVMRLLDHAALRRLLHRARRRRGVARLRLILDTIHPETKRTRSELERRLLNACERAGLPRPEVNVLVTAGAKRLRPDFLWREAGLILEADSRRFHDTYSAFAADRRREQQLQLAGWRVTSCTWEQVEQEPRALAEILRTFIAQGIDG